MWLTLMLAMIIIKIILYKNKHKSMIYVLLIYYNMHSFTIQLLTLNIF